MQLKPAYLLLSLLFIMTGCRPEEELITGSITGVISTYSQYFTLYIDQSGVQVSLYGDSGLQESTTTDSGGKYLFRDIPYGKYEVDYQKEGFIKTWGYDPVYHIGGYSPTMANFWLNQIPTYEMSLDSLICKEDDWLLLIYMKFNGATELPPSTYGYPVKAFASNSPDVNSDNFSSRGRGYLFEHGSTICGNFYIFDFDDFDQLKADTIYIRLYPLALGQGYWVPDYYPEALGPPSNVLSFIWSR